jgi:DNA (cytosine-5)-methyltransferase 1
MDEGYFVEWRVINAAEYGYAQRRRRTFILAYKQGTKLYNKLEKQAKKDGGVKEWIISNGLFGKAFPVDMDKIKRTNKADVSGYEDLVDLTENFSTSFNNAGVMMSGKILSIETTPILEKPIPLSEIVEKEGVDEHYYIKDSNMDKWTYQKGAKKIERTAASGHKYIFAEGAIAFPDPLSKPARTMLTSEGSLNRSTHIIKDPQTKRLRKLTPVECERINGFPDNWTNSGMPENRRYFMMGNALVCGIIKKIGHQINIIIDKED